MSNIGKDPESGDFVKVGLLFFAHACCSVVLTLFNKTISTGFAFPWTVVCLQNVGTLVCTGSLHLSGRIRLRALSRHHIVPLLIDAVWLVAVLWSAFRAIEKVTVPCYVVVRNTVPFLTAITERAALGRALDNSLIGALVITFSGTLLYSLSDMSIQQFDGSFYALSNAGLVASMCVYERHLMTSLKEEMGPIDLNFWRVLLAMPMMVPFLAYEGFLDRLLELSQIPQTASLVGLSALAAFGIGTLLFGLQGEVSPTTIQVANVGYKCVTTGVSRFTHPSVLHPLGYLGYTVCTSGVLLYTLSRPSPMKKKEG